MFLSLPSWPNPNGLGASLHLTPRVKCRRFASIVGADPAGSPTYRKSVFAVRSDRRAHIFLCSFEIVSDPNLLTETA